MSAQAAEAAEPEQRVTALELFFDLVFVFAITQVTAYIAHEPTWTRLAEGMGILIAVWWAWDAYAWLGNTAGTDDGLFRVTLFAALAAMLLAAIALPRAFGADALAFGIAYAVVRALHVGAYRIIGAGDPHLARVIPRLALWMLPASTLLIVAGWSTTGTRARSAGSSASRSRSAACTSSARSRTGRSGRRTWPSASG